ncbi:MAG: hypothetical protein KDK99_07060 [Verrucomicrobiales bacterium]|nr:hypothetical protein [Verrucomicrobiales bacterium]
MSKLNPHLGRDSYDSIEDWSYSPSGGPWKKWLAGVVIPALFGLGGWASIVREKSIVFGQSGNAELNGPAAVSMGVGYLGLCVFLHFHYFWGLSESLARWSAIGKGIGLVAFTGGIVGMVAYNFNFL